MRRIFVWSVLGAVIAGHICSAQTASAVTGLWQNLSKVDQLSGKKVFIISLTPTANTDNDFSSTELVIRCDQNSNLSLQTDWDQSLTNDSSILTYEIAYRIGSNDVQTENWQLSTDNEGLFYTGNPLNFIFQLEKSNSFVAQVTPTGMNPITATYDTTGLTNAVVPILKACGFN